MKKLITLAATALVATSVNAFHPNTLLNSDADPDTWHTNEDMTFKDYDGKKGIRYNSPFGVYSFKYPTISYLDAKWGKDGIIYPLVICGYGTLKSMAGVSEPSVNCFAKTMDGQVEFIEMVEPDWYQRLNNGEFPLGLVRGRHFESFETTFYFRDVCDPNDGKKDNRCPTVKNLTGNGKLNK